MSKIFFFESNKKKKDLNSEEKILQFLFLTLYQLQKKNIYCLDLYHLLNNNYTFIQLNEEIQKLTSEKIIKIISDSSMIGEKNSNHFIIFDNNKLFFRKNYLQKKKILERLKSSELQFSNSYQEITFDKRIFFLSKENFSKEVYFFNHLVLFLKENGLEKEKILFLNN